MSGAGLHDIREAAAAGDAEGAREPDSSVAIAEHLARTRFEDLPASVVEAVKASVLDTLGCVLAGTACEDVVAIRKLVAKWGGQPASTVIGSGGVRVPAASAVLANGAAIHQFDYDDTHDRAVMHPSSASLMPALAVAEETGGVSGKAVITAVALSNDLSSRIGLATRGRMWDHPWFRAPLIGLFGATAAAARIMGATPAQHLNALGLALPQAGGTWASLHHKGSSVRSMRDGLAYRNGVLAAELALSGLRGDGEVFDGPYGFYRAYFRGDYERSELTEGLGTRYETERISLKPWPCIRHLHTTLTAVLGLTAEHGLSFEEIAGVLLGVGQVNRDRCRPLAAGGSPANHIDLAGNMLFAVAAAIRHGAIPLSLYHHAGLADDVIANAMPKVRWRYDATLNGHTFEPGVVEIATKAGGRYTARCEVALGHPDNPMTPEQRVGKFLDCAAAAGKPLPRERALRVVDAVTRLERASDIDDLMRLLA
ncbi:MAG: MmgE/PrpD family protein [Burkholderiales bacterium]|nr:MmgE/PrpD family protein [Burkholderiales bacterium]